MYNKEYNNIRCREYYERNKEIRRLKIQEYNNKLIICDGCNKSMKKNNLNYHKKKKCELLSNQ